MATTPFTRTESAMVAAFVASSRVTRLSARDRLLRRYERMARKVAVRRESMARARESLYALLREKRAAWRERELARIAAQTIRFDLDGVHNRCLRDWLKSRANPAQSALGAARHHASEHGAAGAWRADDSFVLFYRDGGTVRRKTWRYGAPIQLGA